MKTVFINCSPKKRFCASEYLLFLQRVLVGGKQAVETLRAPADHARILEQLRDAQAVVFCLLLYVDGVPSHVLRFLEEMEAFCGRNALRLSLYCVANNGYIEGRQNEPLMQVFEHFCTRAGLTWGGGVGIGGGVMLNFYTRILLIVEIALLALNTAPGSASGKISRACCFSTWACCFFSPAWPGLFERGPSAARDIPASWFPRSSLSCSQTSFSSWPPCLRAGCSGAGLQRKNLRNHESRTIRSVMTDRNTERRNESRRRRRTAA